MLKFGRFSNPVLRSSCPSRAPLKNTRLDVFRSVQVEFLDCVIPAWSAGIQADTDVSGRILRTWMPAIHAGMTSSLFHVL